MTIGNVTGYTDTTFYVHLVEAGGLILDTYPLSYYELEDGFTIDENNSDNLFSGSYFIRIIQNQAGCPGVEANSSIFNIYEPSADLGFQVMAEGHRVTRADVPFDLLFGQELQVGIWQPVPDLQHPPAAIGCLVEYEEGGIQEARQQPAARP